MIGVNDTTGLYEFSNSKGVPTYSPDYATDRTMIINLNPKYIGGFTNTFRYGSFTLDVFLQFVKQTGENLFGSYGGSLAGFNENIPVAFLDAWQKPGDHTTYQKFTQTGSDAYYAHTYATGSDFAYTDASYIRLKNVSLAWQLPEKLGKRIGIQSCSFFAHVQNLLTITHYNGIDPENPNGYDLPPLRTITFGLQVVL